jgi:hypothetical protein
MVGAEAGDTQGAPLNEGDVMGASVWKPILVATAISGALDISWAMILTVLNGREIGNMLRFVASGPFPQATKMGSSGAVLGLLVHFALMAIMAVAFVLAATRVRDMIRNPVKWGVLYGLVTYAVLDLLVVPLRFPAAWPPKPLSMATQLFAHIVLVGLVFAFVTRRYLGNWR